jgi:hypothetical protein
VIRRSSKRAALAYWALVDADSIDTEAHFDADRVSVRRKPVSASPLLNPFLEGRNRILGRRQSSPVLLRQSHERAGD